MNIITATQTLQASADANGRSFSDEVWWIGQNLKGLDDELYDAWTLWHKEANEHIWRGRKELNLRNLAKQVNELKSYSKEDVELYNSLIK